MQLIVHKHRNTKRLQAHPLICWLAKLFRPLDPWVEIIIPPDNKYVYRHNNYYYVSPEQSRMINMENIS